MNGWYNLFDVIARRALARRHSPALAPGASVHPIRPKGTNRAFDAVQVSNLLV